MTEKSRLEHIPLREMISDLIENERDIAVCQYAIQAGRTHYRDGEPIEKWLKVGEEISKVIWEELERRFARISDSF